MSDELIRYEFEALEPGDDLNAEDFLGQMRAFLDALKEADEQISPDRKVEYSVVALSRTNPYCEGLRPRLVRGDGDPFAAAAIVANRIKEALDTGARAFDDASYKALLKVRGITQRIGKRVSRVSIVCPTAEVEITQELVPAVRDAVRTAISEIDIVPGSIGGTVEMVNTHYRRKQFKLFPVVGPKEITCYVERSQDLYKYGDKYVTVFGDLLYKAGSMYPYAMNVTLIDDEEPGPDDFESLRGSVPNCTAGKTTAEYLKELRNEWD